MRSTVGNKGVGRDFGCKRPPRLPLPAKRRVGFPGLLDIIALVEY